jgi:hypothetical protein
MYDLIEKLIHIQNILEGRGDQVVFPNAIVATHSALPGEPENLGVWWYNLRTKELLYSSTAETHIDREFQEKIPELGRIPNKILANRAGWISGRIGVYQEAIFAFVYSHELNGHMPGPVASELVYKLKKASGQDIEMLTDEDGFNLVYEKKDANANDKN